MREKRRRALVGFGIYAVSFLVRSLYAVDLAPTLYSAAQPGIRMALRYDDTACEMLRGDGLLVPRVVDPSRTGLIARPPGYPYLLRWVYALFGRGFPMIELLQNLANSLGPVLTFLLASALLGEPAGVLAGLLSALSPQLGYASNLIAADALSGLPLLAAFLLLLPRVQAPIPARSAGAGALLGLSVWLRPNVVLMAPFLALFLLAAARRKNVLARHLLAAMAAAALVVVPMTLRNYFIFGAFVPTSTNGGLSMWEGMAEAGGEEFGARRPDLRVAQEEALRYGRPEYASWWAEPDGIWRDHERFRRSLEVIRLWPGLFARAVLRRMWSMVAYHSSEAPFVARREGEAPEKGRAAPEDEEDAFERFEARGEDLPGPWISEEATLLPGRAFSIARPLTRALQAVFAVTTLPMLALGLAFAFRADWRSALPLLALPAYYLLSESLVLYEWRVATPMHYGLMAFAGAGWVALGRLLRGGSVLP